MYNIFNDVKLVDNFVMSQEIYPPLIAHLELVAVYDTDEVSYMHETDLLRRIWQQKLNVFKVRRLH